MDADSTSHHANWTDFVGHPVSLIVAILAASVDLAVVVGDNPDVLRHTGFYLPVGATFLVAFLATLALDGVHRVATSRLLPNRILASIDLDAAIFASVVIVGGIAGGIFRAEPRYLRSVPGLIGLIAAGIVAAFAARMLVAELSAKPRLRRVLLLIAFVAPIGIALYAAGGAALELAPARVGAIRGLGVVLILALVAVAWKKPVLASWGAYIVLAAVLLVGARSEWGDWDWLRPPADNAAEAGGAAPRQVVLITIDTLRYDALAMNGQGGVSTPGLEQLAEDGVVFDQMWASAPWTLPSFVTMLTGLEPLVHRVKDGSDKIPSGMKTISERFGEKGYSTAGIGRNMFLLRNFKNRFDTYSFFPIKFSTPFFGWGLLRNAWPTRFQTDVTSTDISKRAVSWLNQYADNDFFLWVHFYDPHYPYTPPSKYKPRYRTSRVGSSFTVPLKTVRAGFWTPSRDDARAVHELYLAEVRYVDHEVRRIIKSLKKRGLYDDALIVVASDHGEEFWDHGQFEHGHAIYDELLRVPFIVKPPASMRIEPHRVPDRVFLDSVTPTILDLAGLSLDNPLMTGPSLVPLVKGTGGIPERPLVMAGSLHYDQKMALVFGDYKYIERSLTGTEDLYDLVKDPHERVNLANDLPDTMEQARRLMEVERDRADRFRKDNAVSKAHKSKYSKTEEETLRSLGYLN